MGSSKVQCECGISRQGLQKHGVQVCFSAISFHFEIPFRTVIRGFVITVVSYCNVVEYCFSFLQHLLFGLIEYDCSPGLLGLWLDASRLCSVLK